MAPLSHILSALRSAQLWCRCVLDVCWCPCFGRKWLWEAQQYPQQSISSNITPLESTLWCCYWLKCVIFLPPTSFLLGMFWMMADDTDLSPYRTWGWTFFSIPFSNSLSSFFPSSLEWLTLMRWRVVRANDRRELGWNVRPNVKSTWSSAWPMLMNYEYSPPE